MTYNTSQYRNLNSKDVYIDYLKSHEDLENILELHKWLAIRYAVYMPYGKSQIDWYFVFLLDKNLAKNEAMGMMEKLGLRPKILFPTREHIVYK